MCFFWGGSQVSRNATQPNITEAVAPDGTTVNGDLVGETDAIERYRTSNETQATVQGGRASSRGRQDRPTKGATPSISELWISQGASQQWVEASGEGPGQARAEA